MRLDRTTGMHRAIHPDETRLILFHGMSSLEIEALRRRGIRARQLLSSWSHLRSVLADADPADLEPEIVLDALAPVIETHEADHRYGPDCIFFMSSRERAISCALRGGIQRAGLLIRLEIAVPNPPPLGETQQGADRVRAFHDHADRRWLALGSTTGHLASSAVFLLEDDVPSEELEVTLLHRDAWQPTFCEDAISRAR
jgi:hypothetical protein